MDCREERKNKWIPTVNGFIARNMLLQFLKKYESRYPGKTKVLLEMSLADGIGSYWNPMEFFQIYSYLGLFNNQDNIYYGYYKKMAEEFNIDCNILDVACGYVPAFGMIVAGKQLELPNSRGTVTMCDPALVLDPGTKGNMTLVRDKFDKDVVRDYDLITGIMPCSVTRDLIEAACEQNKDFYVGLCGCPPEDYVYTDDDTYLDKNIRFAKDMCSRYGRTFNETHLDSDYVVSMPVIYSKKR